MSTKTGVLVAAGAIAAMLWTSPAAADVPGAMPGDDAMTCEQIAVELKPYVQQIMPAALAAAQAAQEAKQRGEQRVAEEMPAAIALTMAATAASADPTGIASRAVGQAEMMHQQEVWNRSLAEDKPVYDRLNARTGDLVAQGQQMQGNARLQRLTQLVQDKHCDKR